MIESYRILSFCGGGIRGLASVTMLRQLYENHLNIISAANMLAGTSTGGGIVAALTTGSTPQDQIEHFMTKERDFFKCKSTAGPSKPMYSTAEFALGQPDKFKRPLSSFLPQHLLLTSFNVGDKDTPWAPILFNNLPGSATADTHLADAVVSTGAMPGMFGSYLGNVDGAFVHHDPTLAAIALAVNSGVSLADIVVICFGTGFMANNLGGATATWGAQQWQQGDPANPYNVLPLLINGTPSPILNISLSGTSTNLIPMLAGMMLPGRYAYLNPVLDHFIPENETNLTILEGLRLKSAGIVKTPAYATAKNLVETYWPKSLLSGPPT